MIRKLFGVLFVIYGVIGSIITLSKLGLIGIAETALPEISILQPLGIVNTIQEALYLDLIIAVIAFVIGVKLLHKKKQSITPKV